VDKAYNYQGLNGEDHRFALADMTNPRALPSRGGVIAIVRSPSDPVYIADTASVRAILIDAGLWRIAQQEHGAKGVYLLTSGNEDWRQSVAQNLRARYSPVMNR
jgi:hypothetical protein